MTNRFTWTWMHDQENRSISENSKLTIIISATEKTEN